MRIDTASISRVAEMLALCADDEETFWDTLDGETNALDIIDALLVKDQEAEDSLSAIEARIETLKARAGRIDQRRKATRRALITVLQAADQRRVERPLATLSLVKPRTSVRIIDEREIPSQLMTVKTTTAPDKDAIKKQLEAGESVPGATLELGSETISVRTK